MNSPLTRASLPADLYGARKAKVKKTKTKPKGKKPKKPPITTY